jgi:hypothetical protein
MNKPVSVMQEWVQRLSFMQQSVLIAAIRGPDGLEAKHVSKLLIRWLRRCVLYSAFESKKAGQPTAILNPYAEGGGSFTGPSCEIELTGPSFMDPPSSETLQLRWMRAMDEVVTKYMSILDGVPHHFQLHFLHAAEIVGYRHEDPDIGSWWIRTYARLVNDMHLKPETANEMDKRLGDFEADWRAAEKGSP